MQKAENNPSKNLYRSNVVYHQFPICRDTYYTTFDLARMLNTSLERIHTLYIYTGEWQAKPLVKGAFGVPGWVVADFIESGL